MLRTQFYAPPLKMLHLSRSFDDLIEPSHTQCAPPVATCMKSLRPLFTLTTTHCAPYSIPDKEDKDHNRRKDKREDIGRREDKKDMNLTTRHSFPPSYNSDIHYPFEQTLLKEKKTRKHRKRKYTNALYLSISVPPWFSSGALFLDLLDSYTHLHTIPDAPHTTLDDCHSNIDTDFVSSLAIAQIRLLTLFFRMHKVIQCPFYF
jgi:type IV secretory pathway VirB4 component